jgi:hypothetical protein
VVGELEPGPIVYAAVRSELVMDVGVLRGDKFEPELNTVLGDVDSVYWFVVFCDGCFEVPIKQLGLGCTGETGKGIVDELL